MCLICFNCILLGACASPPAKPSDKHIQASNIEPSNSADIPQPVTRSIPLPPPTAAPKTETYSVVVTNVPAQEILFALARDAKINLDIHNGIQGTVTINAINQTLPQILNRIAQQVDMRYELDGQTLIVRPDSPYLKHYRIDYVNMARDSDGSITDSTQVGGAVSGASGGSSSSLSIKNSSKNHFWETLTQNIKDILRETDKVLPSGSSETTTQQATAISTTGTGAQPAAGTTKSSVKATGIENSPIPATLQEGGTTVTRTNTFREAASVIANPESGVIAVRATSKQHEKIQAFLDEVMTSARRQVLIEATIVEVRLNDQNQQGINWSWLRSGSRGFNVTQQGSAGLPATNSGSMFVLNFANPNKTVGNLTAQISLLESFGTVKVLSSPKISVMNNQTAVLRVVDNLVYFNIKTQTDTTTGVATTTFTTTANTVPVGFTMSVTPQINDSDTVQLNLRPSITRLLSYINDPNPILANPCGVGAVTCATPSIVSKVPQVQTREMESIIKIESNQIAVMGGLMQDEVNNLSDNVPGLSNLPLVGALFKNRNDTNTKTELVIFLRPVVIKDASLNGDYGAFRSNLPQQDFLEQPTAESATRTQ